MRLNAARARSLFISVIAMILILAPVSLSQSALGPVTLRFNPSTVTAERGASFSADLAVEGLGDGSTPGEQLAGADLTLTFPTFLLDVDSCALEDTTDPCDDVSNEIGLENTAWPPSEIFVLRLEASDQLGIIRFAVVINDPSVSINGPSPQILLHIPLKVAPLAPGGCAEVNLTSDPNTPRNLVSDTVEALPYNFEPLRVTYAPGNCYPSFTGFSSSPRMPVPGTEVIFTAVVRDPDDDPVSFTLDFGDGTDPLPGTSGLGCLVGCTIMGSHTYSAAGPKGVILSIDDGRGGTASESITVSVTAPENSPPAASFTPSPSKGNSPITITFDATGSSDTDGRIVEYAWDFGDSFEEVTPNPTVTHYYDDPGTYTVTLVVRDDKGAEGSAQRDIILTRPMIRPEARFIFAPTVAMTGEEVTFNASASSDPDGGSLVKFVWDFGDGQGAEGSVVRHTFASPRQYNVKLTVEDNEGNESTSSSLITILAPTQPTSPAPMNYVPFIAGAAILLLAILAGFSYLRHRRAASQPA